jgi:hypothetical protein
VDIGPTGERVRIDDLPCANGCSVDFAFPHARDEAGRPLSVVLQSAWAEGPLDRVGASRWTPGRPSTLAHAGVRATGLHGPERLVGGRLGAWTEAHFRATFPIDAGTLQLRVARPEHAPGSVRISTPTESKDVDVGPHIATIPIQVDAIDGAGWLEIESPAFVPTDVRQGTADQRELGLILFEVEFVPALSP